MNKPVFPKPQLIREDFLPEQNSMWNYRIKKITKPDGVVLYYPEKRIFGFLWINISGPDGYSLEKWAQSIVFSDYNKHQKVKVEYLSPDSSMVASNEPPYKLKKSTDSE